MSYHADKRVVIGPPGSAAVTDDLTVVIHEDRGDGTAACAVGSQMGITKPFIRSADGVVDEWIPLEPGLVDCQLCARARAEARTHPQRARTDGTARPLSERTPRRMDPSRLGLDLPWRNS